MQRNGTRLQTRKVEPPAKRDRGKGTIDRRQLKGGEWHFRAKKRLHNQNLLGEWREDRDEAIKDLATLTWKPKESKIPTLRQFMLKILKEEREAEVAGSTYIREDVHFRTRIINSDLGRKRLDLITDVDCQTFLSEQKYKVRFEPLRDENGKVRWEVKNGRRFQVGRHVMSDEPLGPDGAREIAKTLRVYFKKAKGKRFRYIKASPLVDIEYPRKPANKEIVRKWLNEDEATDLHDNLLSFITNLHSQKQRFMVMVHTLLHSGVRPGELRALKTTRILLTYAGQAYIEVSGGRSRKARGGEKDAGTKTGNSKQIPITDETYEMIMSLPRSSKSEYVFHTRSGKPVDARNFRRDFRKFCEATALENATLHGLRHTYASLLVRGKVSPKTVQNLLRHADPKVVMEIYAHAFDDDMAAAPIVLRELLTENKKRRAEQESVQDHERREALN